MLKKLFAPDEIDTFGKSLAEDIRLRYPPSVAADPARRISVNRLTSILNATFIQAAEFSAERKLGAFKKARLGNTFQWELKELGYNEDFVKVATEGLIVFITDAKRTKRGSGTPDKS